MPGFQSSSGSQSVTSSDGGASGAVGLVNKDSEVRDIILTRLANILFQKG